jgi:hypothetical protein
MSCLDETIRVEEHARAGELFGMFGGATPVSSIGFDATGGTPGGWLYGFAAACKSHQHNVVNESAGAHASALSGTGRQS